MTDSVNENCVFFKKRSRKNVRQKEGSSSEDETVIKTQKRRHINNMLYQQTSKFGGSGKYFSDDDDGNNNDKLDSGALETVTYKASHSKESRITKEYIATATLEIDTDVKCDAQAIFENAQKINQKSENRNVYMGLNNYAQYIEKKDTIMGNASSGFNRKGPMRAPANLRATVRWDYQPDICKDYKETGFCSFGDSCKFLHDRSDYKHGWQIEQELAEGVYGIDGDDNRYEISHNSSEDESFEDISLVCMICRKDYKDPVVTICKHYFCSDCALKRYKKTARCYACTTDTKGFFKFAKNLLSRIAILREKKKKHSDSCEMRTAVLTKALKLVAHRLIKFTFHNHQSQTGPNLRHRSIVIRMKKAIKIVLLFTLYKFMTTKIDEEFELPSSPLPFKGSQEDRIETRERQALFVRQALRIVERFARNPVNVTMLSHAPFCSDWCFRASFHIRKQISKEPAWCRPIESLKPCHINLLSHNASGHVGKVILDVPNRLLLTGSESDSSFENELSIDDESDSVDLSSSTLEHSRMELEKLALEMNTKNSPLVREICSSALNHVESTLHSDQRERDITSRSVSNQLLSDNQNSVTTNICDRLSKRLQGWLTEKALSVLTTYTFTSDESSSFDSLHKRILQQFYPKHGSSKRERNQEETQFSVSSLTCVLPLIDSVSPQVLRRQILLDSLKRSKHPILDALKVNGYCIYRRLETASYKQECAYEPGRKSINGLSIPIPHGKPKFLNSMNGPSLLLFKNKIIHEAMNLYSCDSDDEPASEL
ncbi:E3 ubiquitin-protein ligase [Schistosoma japonicum]|nr:E3 ubiquitin-protein ligase [Schistosoma japonicum]KAH8852568.1 E3 ubiquitin-protein ligase [Schistosoma japonicum]